MNNNLAPLKLRLYGVDNEIKRELSRSIIPWGILERAIDLQEALSGMQVDEGGQTIVEDPAQFRDQIQQLTDFVIFIFDDTVTAEELKRGASVQDMLALYRQIFSMVSNFKNPIPALTPAQNLQKVRQGSRK